MQKMIMIEGSTINSLGTTTMGKGYTMKVPLLGRLGCLTWVDTEGRAGKEKHTYQLRTKTPSEQSVPEEFICIVTQQMKLRQDLEIDATCTTRCVCVGGGGGGKRLYQALHEGTSHHSEVLGSSQKALLIV